MYSASVELLQVSWRPITALKSASLSASYARLSSGGGNEEPCLLEEATETCCLTTRILFTGPAEYSTNFVQYPNKIRKRGQT